MGCPKATRINPSPRELMRIESLSPGTFPGNFELIGEGKPGLAFANILATFALGPLCVRGGHAIGQ
jgi:hypothetical protein